MKFIIKNIMTYQVLMDSSVVNYSDIHDWFPLGFYVVGRNSKSIINNFIDKDLKTDDMFA
jgi:hypothetical protein